MSINKYDEQKFWEEVDILFPDIVKAITSLAKKSYCYYYHEGWRCDQMRALS